MIRLWMASAVLSLALAGQAWAQTPADGGASDTENDAGTMSPSAPGEGVDRSTDTTGVDRSTGTPSGLEDPTRRGTRPRPGAPSAPGTENDTGTGGGTEGSTTPPPPPSPAP